MSLMINRRSALFGLGATSLLASCHVKTKAYDAEVIILGAGLSGLHAARLLISEGKDVLVLEGSNRIGGRLRTIDIDGKGTSEAGGEEVGAGYARIRSEAADLGVNIPDSTGSRLPFAYNVGGKNMLLSEWASSEFNPYPNSLKTASPGGALGRLAYQNNPLADVYSWPSALSEDISAYDWLKSKGLSDKAIALDNHSLNGNDLKSYSMLNLFRSLKLYVQDQSMGKSGSIEGGSQRLPEAMAASLPRDVMMDQRVTKITDMGDHVIVEVESGKTYKAGRVICTIPFAALSKIELSAPLSAAQSQAMKRLPYTQILQVHFESESPFWEADGLPASMWSDGPLERIFARPDDDKKPDGIFRAWINGTGAKILAEKSDDEIAAMTRQEMQRLRPASGGHIKVHKVIRWTEDNPLAGGAYMHFSPGQVGPWYDEMGLAAGRIHFAGAHLSKIHTGLEGAMESGETAAFELMDY